MYIYTGNGKVTEKGMDGERKRQRDQNKDIIE